MKKLISFLLSVLTITSLLLIGCSSDDFDMKDFKNKTVEKKEIEQKVDAKAASETLINFIIYDKDEDKFNKIFTEDSRNQVTNYKSNSEKAMRDYAQKQFPLSSNKQQDNYNKIFNTALNTYMLRVKDTTKYSVTISSTSENSTIIDVSVNSLDIDNFRNDFTNKLKDDVKNNPEPYKDHDMATIKILETFNDVIKVTKISDTPRNITINLKSTDNQKHWALENSEESITKIVDTFYNYK